MDSEAIDMSVELMEEIETLSLKLPFNEWFLWFGCLVNDTFGDVLNGEDRGLLTSVSSMNTSVELLPFIGLSFNSMAQHFWTRDCPKSDPSLKRMVPKRYEFFLFFLNLAETIKSLDLNNF